MERVLAPVLLALFKPFEAATVADHTAYDHQGTDILQIVDPSRLGDVRKSTWFRFVGSPLRGRGIACYLQLLSS